MDLSKAIRRADFFLAESNTHDARAGPIASPMQLAVVAKPNIAPSDSGLGVTALIIMKKALSNQVSQSWMTTSSKLIFLPKGQRRHAFKEHNHRNATPYTSESNVFHRACQSPLCNSTNDNNSREYNWPACRWPDEHIVRPESLVKYGESNQAHEYVERASAR